VRPPHIRVAWRKIGLFLLALLLFILSIQFLKSGAKALVPFIREGLAVQNAWNALGFGWLFAYVVLSGSPVAATALTFFDAGAIDRLGAFTMIAGSRLGASFMVLALGFVYALRGHERKGSLAMGLLSLIVTFAVYVPALAVGYGLLRTGAFDWLHPALGGGVVSLVDVVFDPVLDLALRFLPRWVIFLLGFGVLWSSLNLIDDALPNLHLQESAFGGMARLLYRPVVTFALGLLITSLTMSVSVSLSVLVPLSARGYIRRENVIPYIMGANITTFVDTLVAALLLNNPQAFTVVLVEMVSVGLVSLAVLLLIYPPYERAVLRGVEIIDRSQLNLAIFLLIIVGVPVALMFVR
jgi:Na+/phosphate symporter